MMNKVLIIGSSRGLGMGLKSIFSDYDFDVSTIERDLWESLHCNYENLLLEDYSLILVNAHLAYELGGFLNHVMKVTPNTTDLIVIGSMITQTQKQEWDEYQLEKIYCDQCVRQFQLQYKNRFISLVRPGLIDTDFVADKMGVKMPIQVAAKYICESYLLAKKCNVKAISSSFTG